MNYPLISEYVEAIKAAEDNFDQLKHLRPVLGEDGEPVMTSGNFAVVFKMKDEQTGKLHAAKCFLKEQEGRAEAYRMIAEELEFVSSTFLTPIKYLDKELFVDTNAGDEKEFPVLLMDWVEGDTLDKYIRKHLDDQYDLSLLAYQFSRLAMWLMPQPFAHGDLKPDNIIVKEDGTLVLVDYDGMYVPAMKGQKARELGSPDFRHPGRTEEVFDDHIDDFSFASILLSLKAIALQPALLEEYGASDRLLFSEKDYRNLSESSALGTLQPLMQDAELASLYSLFILALSQDNLSQVSFRLFNLSRPDRSQYEEENLSTEVTDEDLANAWTDEFGVKYSRDKKRLLKAPTEIRSYSVMNGTKIICNKSFQSTLLAQVIIPNSVICIGDHAFSGCCLTSIDIPDELMSIGKWAFSYNSLHSVIIPQSVKHIGKGAFGSCGSLIRINVNNENKFYDSRNDSNAIIEKKSNTLIVGCQNTIIPNNVKSIGEWAFAGCCNLSSIFIPKEVLNIGLRAFDGCERLKRISVDKDNESFDSRNDCNAIIETKSNTLIVGCQNTIIPNNVTTIGKWAFSRCEELSTIIIPDSVLNIHEGAFYNCRALSTINLPQGLKEIGSRAFSDSGIESILIPNGVEVINESLFNCCRRLISVTLPNSVTTIENYAFYQCRPLYSISMSDNVITIGDLAFACCSSLTSIELSNSIQKIGKGAFYNCESLKKIFIPLGSKQKFKELLPEYTDKLAEQYEEKNLNSVAEEQLYKGLDFFYGEGVEQDFKKAFDCFTRSALYGNVDAQWALGECYYEGYGVDIDLSTAVEWYRKSAVSGNAEGQWHLGYCYYYGKGVARDYEEAFKWFAKSANQNNANGQLHMGKCYYYGRGVVIDYTKAVEFYTKSAEQGNSTSQWRLGDCYYYGEGCEQNYKKAFEWYFKSAEQGNSTGQWNLGHCYHYGEGIDKNPSKAVEWYQKSAEQGYAAAQCDLGYCYQKGLGIDKDYLKAIELYTKAANNGNETAQNNLGICYEEGIIVEKDIDKAKFWYTEAAKQGNKEAEQSLHNLI